MPEQEIRLGDNVDDYCSRCKLDTDHYVVSLVEGKIKKVRCQTCGYEHNYSQGKGRRKKKETVKSLFDQVLAGLPSTSRTNHQRRSLDRKARP